MRKAADEHIIVSCFSHASKTQNFESNPWRYSLGRWAARSGGKVRKAESQKKQISYGRVPSLMLK